MPITNEYSNCNTINFKSIRYMESEIPSEIPKEHLQSHQDSFVTALNANHLPTEIQEKPLFLLINKLKNSDSIKESKELIKKIKSKAKELADDIQDMRNTYFTVENEGTDEVYGRLVDGYTDVDRDKYIRALVHYKNADNQLNLLDLPHKLSIKEILAPYHRMQVYGDWEALNKLQNKGSVSLPNLIYNRGDIQFG